MPATFTIETFHNTWLAIQPHTGVLEHKGIPDRELASFVFALSGSSESSSRFLLAIDVQNGKPVLLRDPKSGLRLWVELVSDAKGRVSLKKHNTDLFFAAIPNTTQLEGDRKIIAHWEQYKLIPIPQWKSRDNNFTGKPSFWLEALKRTLDDANPTEQNGAFIEAIWPQLTLEDFDRVAEDIKTNPSSLQKIQAAFPNDFWATSALPALVEWINTKKTIPHQNGFEKLKPLSIGPSLDHLSKDGVDGKLVSFAHACNSSIRRQVAPNEGVAIVSSARSEGIYFLEWLAYHRLLGVEKFFIYTNNNDDGSDLLLQALHDADVITWVKNELGPPTVDVSGQIKAYGHALNVSTELLNYRWALLIDLDEFLVLDERKFPNVGEFGRFHQRKQTDAVGINWVMVGSSGEKRWRDSPITRRNTHLLGETNPHIKTMLYPSRFVQAHPHFPFCEWRQTYSFRLANGDVHEHRKQAHNSYHAKAFADTPSEDYACIYHYAHKSVEEFIWKISRNRGDSPVSQGATFDGLIESTISLFLGQHRSLEIRENDRIQRSAPKLEEEIQYLRSLPNVLPAERTVIDHFERQIGALKQQFLNDPRLKQMGSLGQTMRDLVLEIK